MNIIILQKKIFSHRFCY